MTEWNRKEIKEESPVEQAVSSRIEEIRTEKRGWKKWAAGTGAMACVLFLLSHVFFELAVVEGSSMVPGYQDQDLTLYGKVRGELKRGDVVLARIQDGRTLIKRVIGLPGEEIYIEKESGGVYIDGDKLEEPYIQGQTSPGIGQENPLTLQEGEYFIMGDNRENSSDSRYYGPVKEGQIRGKALWSLRKD